MVVLRQSKSMNLQRLLKMKQLLRRKKSNNLLQLSQKMSLLQKVMKSKKTPPSPRQTLLQLMLKLPQMMKVKLRHPRNRPNKPLGTKRRETRGARNAEIEMSYKPIGLKT